MVDYQRAQDATEDGENRAEGQPNCTEHRRGHIEKPETEWQCENCETVYPKTVAFCSCRLAISSYQPSEYKQLEE